LVEQFLSGEQSGGRTTFMLPFEPGFFRDLGIALATDDLQVVTIGLERFPLGTISTCSALQRRSRCGRRAVP
jgi:hypothetical protein